MNPVIFLVRFFNQIIRKEEEEYYYPLILFAVNNRCVHMSLWGVELSPIIRPDHL